MAGAKITDDKQEYQYTLPWVTPSGHEFTFYDTPSNQRLLIRHTSGSHIEFKADGSVFVKAITDVHTHSSVMSTQGQSDKTSDTTTWRSNTDYTFDVGGRLRIRCAELDFEIGTTGRIIAATDLVMSGNNVVTKATESISLEGTKSVYLDTKEFRERVVNKRSEVGTMEDEGAQGGLNVMNVYGNAVIQNDDPNGGITISSKGYLNLVCGQERVDITGMWTDSPSSEAIGTWTQKVFTPKEDTGPLNVSTPGGDYYFESQASSYYKYASKSVDPKYTPDGLRVDTKMGDYKFAVTQGNSVESVALTRRRAVGGNETIAIGGTQTVTASKIYLN